MVFYTTGTLPALPLAPRLVKAGVSWVTLEWGRPEGSPSEEQLKYTLEIQEDNTVSTATGGPNGGVAVQRASGEGSMSKTPIRDGVKVSFAPSGNGLSSKVHWRKLDLYCTRPEEEHAV